MTTKAALPALILLCLLPTAGRPAEAPWLTDFKEAKTRAKAENKRILLSFTGSDWCPWCVRLDEEVFSTPAFQSYAEKEFILVKVDFPREKTLDKTQAKANQKLAEQLKIHGVPTLILADATGKELGRTGYEPGGPSALTASLQAMAKGAAKSAAPSITVQARETSPAAGQPSSKTPQPKPAPAPSLDGLVLQGLAGPANRKLALINNETLAVGESARIRVGKREVRVRCLQIKEQSVVISVDGSSTPQELHLRGAL